MVFVLKVKSIGPKRAVIEVGSRESVFGTLSMSPRHAVWFIAIMRLVNSLPNKRAFTCLRFSQPGQKRALAEAHLEQVRESSSGKI